MSQLCVTHGRKEDGWGVLPSRNEERHRNTRGWNWLSSVLVGSSGSGYGAERRDCFVLWSLPRSRVGRELVAPVLGAGAEARGPQGTGLSPGSVGRAVWGQELGQSWTCFCGIRGTTLTFPGLCFLVFIMGSKVPQ